MTIAIVLHQLCSVIWVGGMFFAYMVLRPIAAGSLEPPLRLKLWTGVFSQFFPWVWFSIVALPITGVWIILTDYVKMANVPVHVHIMMSTGLIMVALFLILYFLPYKKLKTAVNAQVFEEAGKHLNLIRKIIAINLVLGVSTVVVATIGRY